MEWRWARDRHSELYRSFSLAFDKLVRKGRHQEAKALELLVCNKIWCGQRLIEQKLTLDNDRLLCTRCGEADDTPLHRYYQCRRNKAIDDPIIADTDYICREVAEQPQSNFLWFRAIVPRAMQGIAIDYIDDDQCHALELGPFTDILRQTGSAGKDGSLDPGCDIKRSHAGSGAAVFTADGNRAAIFISKVAGQQTAPRAELTALLHTLNSIDTTRQYIIYVDASYVVDGFKKRGKEQRDHAFGPNGDLWTRVYNRRDVISDHVQLIKVKSHLETFEEYRDNDMNDDKSLTM